MLKDWVSNTREDIRFHRRPAEAANDWKMKTGALWRTPERERLRDFYKRAANDLTDLEVEFYDASEHQHERETFLKRAAVAALRDSPTRPSTSVAPIAGATHAA